MQLAAGNSTADYVADYSVVTYPNPFYESLEYVYLLRKPMKVSVELLDLSGKVLSFIENKAIQSGGLHFGKIDSYSRTLAMGVYYLRFTFDNEIYVSKVVKM